MVVQDLLTGVNLFQVDPTVLLLTLRKTQMRNRVNSQEWMLKILYRVCCMICYLRKSGHEKDQSLKDKDDAIEMLSKKVDTLTKAMEVEAKKMRREVAVMEKEVAAMRVHKEQDNRAKLFGSSKGSTNSSQINPARNMTRGGLTRSTQ